MTAPIVERIAAVIEGRLQDLVDGLDARSPVSEVIRPTWQGSNWTPKHQQIVLTQGATVRDTSNDLVASPSIIGWQTTFNIRCHLMPLESISMSIDTIANYMLAGVQMAITQDADEWHTFGGLAINAFWGDIEPLVKDGSFAQLNIPLIVFYRHPETNPY